MKKFTLLENINNKAQQRNELAGIIQEAIDYLGFDRDQVVTSEEDLLEYGVGAPEKEGRAKAMAGEREWLQDLAAQREKEGQEYQGNRLGMERPQRKVTPDQGQYVMVGGALGKIVDTDPQSGQVMISDSKGREFAVKTQQLAGPKMVNSKATWMLRK